MEEMEDSNKKRVAKSFALINAYKAKISAREKEMQVFHQT
jgi:hypothetical protein